MPTFDNPTDQDVLFAAEGAIWLWPALTDGSADTANPVWIGVEVEGIRLSTRYQKVKIAGSGAAFPVEKIVGEEHSIGIDRVWVRRSGGTDVRFVRDKDYVLRIEFASERVAGVTDDRTYKGVRPDERSLDSQGVHEFTERQVFTAQQLE